ncbi:MAG: hypothetical protein ACJAUO_002235 [Sediminicola sp.]|jgi:hypothetical protein
MGKGDVPEGKAAIEQNFRSGFVQEPFDIKGLEVEFCKIKITLHDIGETL